MKRKKEKVLVLAKIVARYYGISFDQMCSRTRKREIIHPRQVAHYLSEIIINVPLHVTGTLVGDMTHATVLNSINTITNLMDTDKDIYNEIQELTDIITPIFDSKNSIVRLILKYKALYFTKY